MQKTWKILEALFRESKQYRGDNSVRLVDLEKMLDAIMEKGQIQDPGTTIHKDGGQFSCHYGFDPKIWGKWFTSQDLALSMAAMDKDVTAQYAGRSQGHTVHKTNWGGRVVNSPGKPRGDFERMPSSMDRYDVIMQGEVGPRAKVNSRTGQTTTADVGTLLRVAYSPSIGSTEERKARLLAFLAGDAAPELRRRPQPHVPEPSKADVERSSTLPAAQNLLRVGQNTKGEKDDDARKAPASAPQKSRDRPDFSQYLSKHNAEYKPQTQDRKARTADDDAEDAMAALFPKGK